MKKRRAKNLILFRIKTQIVIGTNALRKFMCSKLASRTKFIAKNCKEDSGM